MKMKALVCGLITTLTMNITHASLDQNYPQIRHLAQNITAKPN